MRHILASLHSVASGQGKNVDQFSTSVSMTIFFFKFNFNFKHIITIKLKGTYIWYDWFNPNISYTCLDHRLYLTWEKNGINFRTIQVLMMKRKLTNFNVIPIFDTWHISSFIEPDQHNKANVIPGYINDMRVLGVIFSH